LKKNPPMEPGSVKCFSEKTKGSGYMKRRDGLTTGRLILAESSREMLDWREAKCDIMSQ
jgi:hypothetical protein